ncbi:DinB family protein [Paenibacillus sp. SI8]|uniref:DinB family protein n=1 Tax=unclassified Paenibacillus TaxID=185978 RepID=UPI003466BADB
MEVGKARLLLKVASMRSSLDFYRDQLGWELLDTDVGEGHVMLSILPDYLVVLTEAAHSETYHEISLSKWLADNAHRPSHGDSFYIKATSVSQVEQQLRGRGLENFAYEVDPGSVRKLYVPTPDGYRVIYWEELFPTDAEVMNMYERGAAELEAAIQGLSDVELDQAEAPGKWSIRQQVLHMIDLELVTVHKVKFALAESGREFVGNGFSQDTWCAGLDYANRPIESELAMFRAVRQHIIGLCKHLPGALQRTVITSNCEESVAKLLKIMSGHATHHIRVINRIRGIIGK